MSSAGGRARHPGSSGAVEWPRDAVPGASGRGTLAEPGGGGGCREENDGRGFSQHHQQPGATASLLLPPASSSASPSSSFSSPSSSSSSPPSSALGKRRAGPPTEDEQRSSKRASVPPPPPPGEEALARFARDSASAATAIRRLVAAELGGEQLSAPRPGEVPSTARCALFALTLREAVSRGGTAAAAAVLRDRSQWLVSELWRECVLNLYQRAESRNEARRLLLVPHLGRLYANGPARPGCPNSETVWASLDAFLAPGRRALVESGLVWTAAPANAAGNHLVTAGTKDAAPCSFCACLFYCHASAVTHEYTFHAEARRRKAVQAAAADLSAAPATAESISRAVVEASAAALGGEEATEMELGRGRRIAVHPLQRKGARGPPYVHELYALAVTNGATTTEEELASFFARSVTRAVAARGGAEPEKRRVDGCATVLSSPRWRAHYPIMWPDPVAAYDATVLGKSRRASISASKTRLWRTYFCASAELNLADGAKSKVFNLAAHWHRVDEFFSSGCMYPKFPKGRHDCSGYFGE